MSTLAEQWIEEGIQQGMQHEAMEILSRLISSCFQVSSDTVHTMF